MYYTQDHEWIDFLGLSALTGILTTKLSNMDKVEQAAFCPVPVPLEQGAVIAEFRSASATVTVYTPVTGRVVAINPRLLNNPSLLLNGEKHSIWIAKISPAAPYERKGLLPAQQYKQHFATKA